MLARSTEYTLLSTRLQIRIQGMVQGVGFRPCVYKLAIRLSLTGWIYNDGEGVLIEIQGANSNDFISNLLKKLPALARIDKIQTKNIPLKCDEKKFTILASKQSKVTATIVPDSDVCEACLEELFNQGSRFYYYPFINCTYCGPRFTITKQLPYDRCQTTMANFIMCETCSSEYQDPLNRRFHAQPIACSKCGPQLSLSVAEIAQHIHRGKILAIKSIGGYQLVCDAHNEKAVKKLRERKKRDAKPFAVMVANAASASLIARCDAQEITLLSQRTRPIVVVRKAGEKLAYSVAPGLSTLGIMLPYTPLHYLLFHQLSEINSSGLGWLKEPLLTVLVVTSANISEEPLIIDDEQARQALTEIADIIVTHNRPILNRTDDSVMRVINKIPVMIRRARSFAPRSIPLAHAVPCVIALGAYLKNTIAITRDKEVFISQHIGDLNNIQTLKFYHETINHYLKILDARPEYIAHDLHPDFYSTQISSSFNLPTYAAQHHYAHIAAVAAEYQVTEPALGLALDGFGLGADGTAWGGELLLYTGKCCKRLGSLLPLSQPGAEKVVNQTWRMAASVLFHLNLSEEIYNYFSQFKESNYLAHILANKINTPVTSSCGRLFDAASALLNVCTYANYEGQAAMMLESLVTQPVVLNDGWIIKNNQLNMLPLLKYLTKCNPIEGANIFHGTLAAALADWIQLNAEQLNFDRVLLSGGCFLNFYLTDQLIKNLKNKKITALLPTQVPVNDGGISLGQAWLAGNHFLNEGAK